MYPNILTHCILVDSSTVIIWMSPFYFRGFGSIFILSLLFYFLIEILLANNVDPDLMPYYEASDLDLHCIPMTLLWVIGKKRLKSHTRAPQKLFDYQRTLYKTKYIVVYIIYYMYFVKITAKAI